jgi:hypothetical protein
MDMATSLPSVNLDWLLTGRGEMLKPESQQEASDVQEVQELKDRLLDVQRKYIELLEENRVLKNALPVDGKPGAAKQKTAGARKRKSR